MNQSKPASPVPPSTSYDYVVLFGTHTGKTDPRFPIQITLSTPAMDGVKYVSQDEAGARLAEAVNEARAKAFEEAAMVSKRNGFSPFTLEHELLDLAEAARSAGEAKK